MKNLLIKGGAVALMSLAVSSVNAASLYSDFRFDLAAITTANGSPHVGVTGGVGNIYDAWLYPVIGNPGVPGNIPVDANSVTGNIQSLGVSDLLATSVYNVVETIAGGDPVDDPALCNGSCVNTPGPNFPFEIFGGFTDTNNVTTLSYLPASGPAIDGITPVTIDAPINAPPAGGANTQIQNLTPLIGGASDNEGWSDSWILDTDYTLNGILLPAGPKYTSGTIDFYFQELINLDGVLGLTRTLALTLTLTGSDIAAANLDLFFDLTYALPGFLLVNPSGDGVTWVDASTLLGPPTKVVAKLDTNVNPPIPTVNQLLAIDTDGSGSVDAYVRQTDLNATIIFGQPIPTPGTLFLLGSGLLGLAARRRRHYS
jgi:hypothetical protein